MSSPRWGEGGTPGESDDAERRMQGKILIVRNGAKDMMLMTILPMVEGRVKYVFSSEELTSQPFPFTIFCYSAHICIL